jgi:chromosome segregation ATPase
MSVQAKISELIIELQKEKSVNFTEALDRYLEDDKVRIEEIKQEMKDLSEAIKEALRYNDVTFEDCLNEAEDYFALKKDLRSLENKRINLENFINSINN